ncbi:MAG: UDP-N-acetylmuramoyl-tripeptide--D-alanyl-D-alanine ligase [Sulfuriflexus sp.]|nr:UDP-N-acetylmuramoyl-tripeptide--D-alanyl-D-alanine ligase [Sulfuriflexus sp.]
MNACSMPLSQAAEYLGANYSGNDIEFHGVSTDTRQVRSGELFIALQGENFDAHDFIQQAVDAGAVAVVVSRPVEITLPALLVDDTRLALGHLASAWRTKFVLPVIAVTGSNGKTTVKEMIASILAVSGQPLVTKGNLNNDIGVPLTLFNIESQHTHAVIEMGANHAGEIAYLASLVKPNVGVVTNAMSAHLEGFGSLDGVASAKGELFASLDENTVAIINTDDNYAEQWRESAIPAQVIEFGLSENANVRAAEIKFNPVDWNTQFDLQSPVGEMAITLPLAGQHNVANALAACAACIALEVSLEDIQQGLANMQCVDGRLNAAVSPQGATIIDDSYNANPSSLQAGLEVLASMPGKRILVLGDMAELGEGSEELHSQVASLARENDVQYLFALGEQSAAAVEKFGNGGMHFSSHDELAASLRTVLDEHSVVLIKGSRRMQMERIVNAMHEEH